MAKSVSLLALVVTVLAFAPACKKKETKEEREATLTQERVSGPLADKRIAWDDEDEK